MYKKVVIWSLSRLDKPTHGTDLDTSSSLQHIEPLGYQLNLIAICSVGRNNGYFIFVISESDM